MKEDGLVTAVIFKSVNSPLLLLGTKHKGKRVDF